MASIGTATAIVGEIIDTPISQSSTDGRFVTCAWAGTIASRSDGYATVVVQDIDANVSTIVVIPDKAAYQPTNNWDITITDAAGRVLASSTTLSNSTNTEFILALPVTGDVTIEMAGMGDTKRATVGIYAVQ